jgi:hypothetical protein
MPADRLAPPHWVLEQYSKLSLIPPESGGDFHHRPLPYGVKMVK